MRKLTTATWQNRTLEVRELTVAQLDTILNTAEEVSLLDRLLDRYHLSAALVAACTGLAVNELAAATPSELEPLVEAVREVNPDFLAMMADVANRLARP